MALSFFAKLGKTFKKSTVEDFFLRIRIWAEICMIFVPNYDVIIVVVVVEICGILQEALYKDVLGTC